MTNSKLKRKVYESKKARDILDEEFVEFGSTKRNINEFFNLYNTKFYNILERVHKFFSKQSLQYVVDYINPKILTQQDLIQQKEHFYQFLMHVLVEQPYQNASFCYQVS